MAQFLLRWPQQTGITWLGQRWVEMEALPQGRRLDRYAVGKDKDRVLEWLTQLLSVVVDLHCMRVAHRDIHARNVFCLDDGVRLIDFDVAVDYPDDYSPRFSVCYDLTGEGLESPYATNNACLFANHFPYAIGKVIQIDPVVLLKQLRRACEYEARVLMAREQDRSAKLRIRNREGIKEVKNDVIPFPVHADDAVYVVGTHCVGLVDTLIKQGYRSIRVWENDFFRSLHVMGRWVEACEIGGVTLSAGNEHLIDGAPFFKCSRHVARS